MSDEIFSEIIQESRKSLVESTGVDLARDTVAGLRMKFKQLTDEELESCIDYIANAFDLKRK